MPHLCPVISKDMVSPLRWPVALIGCALRVNEKVSVSSVSPTILPFSISDRSPSKELVSFHLGPCQELLSEDDIQLVRGRLSQFTGLGVRQILVDGPLDRDKFVLLGRRWSRIFRCIHLARFGRRLAPSYGFSGCVRRICRRPFLQPKSGSAALVIAVRTLTEGGIMPTVDSKHAHIIVQLSFTAIPACTQTCSTPASRTFPSRAQASTLRSTRMTRPNLDED
jgi:hypothetical protein